jgi:hypothetical protein
MMMMLRRFVPLFGLLLFASGSPASAAGKGFTKDQTVQLADQLTTQVGIQPDKRSIIRDRLEKWYREDRDVKFAGTPVMGVFAYRAGEGGLIVEVLEGHGLLRYYGQDKDHTIKLKSVSAGAQAGGNSEDGIGIVLGPDAPMTFGGEYKMTSVGATAGTAGVSNSELSKSGSSDRVILLASGNGFSAKAGGGSLKIIVEH